MKKILIILFVFYFTVVACAEEKIAVFKPGMPVEKTGECCFQGGIRLDGATLESGLSANPASAKSMKASLESSSFVWPLAGVSAGSGVISVIYIGMASARTWPLEGLGKLISYSLIGATMGGISVVSAIMAVCFTGQAGDDFNRAIDDYNKSLDEGILKTGAVFFDDGAGISMTMKF